jgi:hypothetical protein
MKSMIFWVEVLGSLIEVHHVLQEDNYLHIQDEKVEFYVPSSSVYIYKRIL